MIGNEYMKRKVASYSMGICKTIKEVEGDVKLEEVIKNAAAHSAEGKARKARLSGNALHIALGNLLEQVLIGFDSLNVSSRTYGDTYLIENPDCGCLPPFLDQAESFGFTNKEARKYTCMRCFEGFKSAAEILGLEFAVGLTVKGCYMEFKK